MRPNPNAARHLSLATHVSGERNARPPAKRLTVTERSTETEQNCGKQGRHPRLMRNRLRTRLRPRRGSAAYRQLNIRGNDDRWRLFWRQLGRRRDGLRTDNRLPRERTRLDHRAALAVIDAALGVDDHGSAEAVRRGEHARRGTNRRQYDRNRCCQKRLRPVDAWHGGPFGVENAGLREMSYLTAALSAKLVDIPQTEGRPGSPESSGIEM